MNKPADILDPQTWLEEHGNYLFSFALLRVKDQHVAEDLVQETLLAAIAAKNTFSHKSSIRTWLVGILKHKLIDHYRQQERNQIFNDYDVNDDKFMDSFFGADAHWIDKLSVFQNPEATFSQMEFWEIFQKCLSKLSAQQAMVFIAKEIDGLTHKDICKQLSITATNQWVLMHRARLALIKCLKKRWID